MRPSLSMLTMANIECHTPAGMPTTVLSVMMRATAGIRKRDRMALTFSTLLPSIIKEQEWGGECQHGEGREVFAEILNFWLVDVQDHFRD